jgi:hypothetical protein
VPAATKPRLDKRAFFRDLGYRPHPGQMEVHTSTAPRRVVACGVRWGKTLSAAMEALAAAMEPRERSVGWIVAPTYDLCDRVFRELSILCMEHLRYRVVKFKEHEKRILLRNLGGGLSEIRGKSAENPTSLLGEGLDWVIIDEASRLRPHIWEGHISQRLIDKRGWALLISTPKGKGWFYDLFQRGQPGAGGETRDPAYRSWNNPSWTNPHLDADLIQAERERLPQRVFAQEYAGEFVEGAGQVFRKVRERATGEWQEPVRGQEYFAGLDLAKTEDYTVLVVLNREREVVHVDRFHRIDWSLQVARIHAALARYHDAQVYVDTTGAGEPVYESLCGEGCDALAYQFTNRSKAALVDNLAILLERELLTLPKPQLWPEGIDELEGFQYSVTDTGNTRTAAPSGQHDDCVVALALAAWHLPPETAEWGCS